MHTRVPFAVSRAIIGRVIGWGHHATPRACPVQGDPVDVGSSLIGVQKQLADVEEETAEGGRGSCRGRVRMWEVFDMCVFGR